MFLHLVHIFQSNVFTKFIKINQRNKIKVQISQVFTHELAKGSRVRRTPYSLVDGTRLLSMRLTKKYALTRSTDKGTLRRDTNRFQRNSL